MLFGNQYCNNTDVTAIRQLVLTLISLRWKVSGFFNKHKFDVMTFHRDMQMMTYTSQLVDKTLYTLGIYFQLKNKNHKNSKI